MENLQNQLIRISQGLNSSAALSLLPISDSPSQIAGIWREHGEKESPLPGNAGEIQTERDLAKREEGQMKSACVPNNRGEVVGVV